MDYEHVKAWKRRPQMFRRPLGAVDAPVLAAGTPETERQVRETALEVSGDVGIGEGEHVFEKGSCFSAPL